MIKLSDVLVFLALLAVSYVVMFEQDLMLNLLLKVVE